MNNKDKIVICPAFQSTDIIPIMYGLPNPEAGEKERRGEKSLGGCIIDSRNTGYKGRI